MADSEKQEDRKETPEHKSVQKHKLSRYINSKYQDSVFKDLFKSREYNVPYKVDTARKRDYLKC